MMFDDEMADRFEQDRQTVFHSTATDKALARITARKLTIHTIIDIGASDGSWSRMALKHWPDAHVLLVDANPDWDEKMRAFAASEPNASYVRAAAGNERGVVAFTQTPGDPYSGGVPRGERLQHNYEVPMTTIDFEVESRGLPAPYLLKFDTHGFERPILAGCRNVLAATNLIVMEMYNFQDDLRRFPAACLHLESLGFRCIDFSELLYRPYDFSLWQFDALYIRSDRPEFAHSYDK
jgi:FkbM family methyltransferase